MTMVKARESLQIAVVGMAVCEVGIHLHAPRKGSFDAASLTSFDHARKISLP
jgi:hypothetical protein